MIKSTIILIRCFRNTVGRRSDSGPQLHFLLFAGLHFSLIKLLKTLSRADFRGLHPKIFSGGGFFCWDGQGWFWDVKKCRKWRLMTTL